MLDIHAHILPGVDDGAADDAVAVEMLKAARSAGIEKIVATPHARKASALERAGSAYGRARDLAKGFGIQLILGCELGVSALAGCVISPETLAPFMIGDTRTILLEFPADVPPVDWEYLVSDIARAGCRVIIAHPERYPYVARNLALAKDLISYGCELQLDAGSFLNGRFSAERRTAYKLLDGGLASYIASDAHRPKDYEALIAVRRRLGNAWPTGGLLENLIP
jgi:protein-tyrosine phosphatase